MVDNTDIHARLTDQMTRGEHLDSRGFRTYTLPLLGAGELVDEYLYRAMDLDEATRWFDAEWIPLESGIPWSTNQAYSENNYLKGDRVVQIEVPASDILGRIRAVGSDAKYEGDGQTWGTGPRAENSYKPSRDANKALVELHRDLINHALLPEEVKKFKKPQILKKQRHVANALFTTMFKDKMGQGKVVRRRIRE